MNQQRKISRRALLKGSLAAAGGAVLAPALAACGGEGRGVQDGVNPNGKIAIEYWIGVSQDTTTAFQSLIDEFNEANPNVTVNLKSYPSYADVAQALQTAAAARKMPAVVGLGYKELRYAAELIPHANIPDLPGFNAGWLEQNFAKAILDLGKVNGTQHIMPFLLGTPYLFYNADAFEQAGLSGPPRTWLELRDHARRLTDEIGRPSFSIPEEGYMWAYQSFIESNGVRLLEDTGSGYRVGIDGAGGVEALQLMAGMILEDETAVLVDDEQAAQSFQSGQLPLITGAGATVRAAQKQGNFNVGSAPLPVWEGKQKRVPVAGNGFFVPDVEPERQAAAWQMIEFLNEPETLTRWSEATGYPPPRSGLMDDPQYLKAFFDENRILRPELEQLGDEAVPYISWPGENGLEALEVLVDARDRIITDGQEAAPTLREAARRAEDLLND